ncbi:MAG TPA: thioredoxin-disulfide reductase [bacterium]|nr:MAG: Thioredoxin reductase [Parcubacteria group bacterium ADurb.Bin192]HPN15210.1 thioredoxin-disulfide reductase [bacterium]
MSENDLIIADIGVIGAGPAGYSAAIYGVRAGLTVAVWTGPEPGGQLMTTNMVENFIGFPEGIMGPELMERSRQQVEHFGGQIINEIVTGIEPQDGEFLIKADKRPGKVKAVIIATGAVARWLGTESEAKFRGRGISACATCDGFFFKGKKVTVVGAGDVAMEDAMTLAKYADSVVVLVRGTEESMKASKIMQDRAKQNPKIKFMFNSEIEEFLGDQFLQSIRIKNNVSGEMQEMPMDGVFMAIGHKPNTDMVKGLVEIDEGGWIKVKGTQTSVPGIFAAGDVADKVYRQAITSAGTGCMALLDAKKWLEHK